VFGGWPFESKVPNEIRLFSTSGTCLTSHNILTTPSNILILILYMPIILQCAPLPIVTIPKFTDL